MNIYNVYVLVRRDTCLMSEGCEAVQARVHPAVYQTECAIVLNICR